MKTEGALMAMTLCVLLFATPAMAQSSAPAHGQAPPAAAPGDGMKGGGMPMMDMCRQMMAGGDMPMMHGGPPADPKERAAMLEMRGEMMKAMGEIMMKHARRMDGLKGQ